MLNNTIMLNTNSRVFITHKCWVHEFIKDISIFGGGKGFFASSDHTQCFSMCRPVALMDGTDVRLKPVITNNTRIHLERPLCLYSRAACSAGTAAFLESGVITVG